jgi:BlaI family penicillinase repressor
MELLWAQDPSTGEAVRIGIGKDRVLTDSTIRTVPRRLEAKQFVRHEVDGRQFLYSSAREPRKVAAEAVRSALRNFCRSTGAVGA